MSSKTPRNWNRGKSSMNVSFTKYWKRKKKKGGKSKTKMKTGLFRETVQLLFKYKNFLNLEKRLTEPRSSWYTNWLNVSRPVFKQTHMYLFKYRFVSSRWVTTKVLHLLDYYKYVFPLMTVLYAKCRDHLLKYPKLLLHSGMLVQQRHSDCLENQQNNTFLKLFS